MTLSLWLARILGNLAGKCRDRHNYQALSHLDSHLLQDIGLRRERGIIMPIHAEAPALDRLAVPAQRETPGETRADDKPRHCPHCGVPLT